MKFLIAPQLAFAQIFHSKIYGQDGMHKSIVNVPTNLNLMEIVLPWMSHDDSSIYKHIKNKNINVYMLGYAHPNIIIRVLQKTYLTFLYKKTTIFNKNCKHKQKIGEWQKCVSNELATEMVLITNNRKCMYQITNIYFKTMKILIIWILFSI